MKLPSLRSKPEAERAPKPIEILIDPMVKAIWSAPADFNRAMRRSVKLWGSIWKWDAQVLGAQNIVPRYVRRHFTDTILTNPRTRRQRRHRARILRAMKGTS